MDYFEVTVLVLVFLVVMAIVLITLVDVGRDVMKAAKQESKEKRRNGKLPDNVVQFSREKKKRHYRAVK